MNKRSILPLWRRLPKFFTSYGNPTIWTFNDMSATGAPSIIAPDGSEDTFKLIETATNQIHRTNAAMLRTRDNTVYSFSTFLKFAERPWISLYMTLRAGGSKKAWFNIQTGALGTAESGVTHSIQAWPNGWYRCSITMNIGAGAMEPGVRIMISPNDNQNVAYMGVSGYGVFAWGPVCVERPSFNNRAYRTWHSGLIL